MRKVAKKKKLFAAATKITTYSRQNRDEIAAVEHLKEHASKQKL